MTIEVPNMSLIVLIGPSGCGKSTFAAKHFLPTEVISSDYCRGLVADDENDQGASNDAFDLLHHWLDLRLKRGRVTVVDATNVEAAHRKTLLEIAKRRHVLSVAIVFDLPVRVCADRNAGRPDREFGAHVIRRQASALRRSFYNLRREGFRHIYVFKSPSEVDSAEVVRTKLWNDRSEDHGPFDIVGDVHGCNEELQELLVKLGYDQDLVHPEGRRVVFLGDLVDRGPNSVGVLKTAMRTVAEGRALCVPGNHDVKLMRKLKGRDVQVSHGLEKTLAELEHETAEFKEEAAKFIDGLVSHLVLDDGKLVVAHAGLKEEMHGRASARVRDFALYGDTTGETDEFGLPVRYPWAQDYRGQARVVYGHTPVPDPEWLNRTINIDTGCAFGGRLTALRYPELELVSVPAKEMYAVPSRPFLPAEASALKPVFGEKLSGVDYQHRPSVYAVARNAEGRVAVVREAGGWFLPGGGIHPGEDASSALLREIREECQLEVFPVRRLGEAVEYVHAEGEGYFEKDSEFHEVHFGEAGASSQVEWLTLAEAAAGLRHESHRWAVKLSAQASLERSSQHLHDDVLDLEDICGKRRIETSIISAITIREENAFAAVEIMSRFAVDPKWLIYLPPTMSPSETSAKPEYLEHPDDAFAYFREQGVERAMCQEKHMGSRAVIVVVRDPSVAVSRFGLAQPAPGSIYTRTGRPFFEDSSLEADLLGRVCQAAEAGGLWELLETDWMCLDGELMPWSAKAQELLRRQFAPVGAAAIATLSAAAEALPSLGLEKHRESALRYREAYRRYCWTVDSVEDYRIAPFHLLASEGAVHIDKDHAWHMTTLGRLCADEQVLVGTETRSVELADESSCASAAEWWEELTSKGGEGMVVKPSDFIAKGPRDWVQPALKCRGREYLRIIYGPNYLAPENLERLRQRSVGRKRSLALREFSLGVEALHRFVKREPLRRVHECVFGVLALESEPVDPRL